MSHAISYNLEESVIEIKVQGDFFLSEAEEMIAQIIQVAIEQNCFLVLNDMRKARLKLSTLEIYELPKIVSNILALSGLQAYQFKRALVAAEDLRDYDFFETVTLNRGQSSKFFLDMDDARKWLFGK